MPGSTQYISVVIPTCNRPDDLRRCLDSLTHVVYSHWDILVVDQSDDGQIQALVESYAHRLPTLAYRRMDQKGACRARNVGLQLVGGDIVALLDDDCTVEAGWLKQVAGAFERHPEAALIVGTVRSAPHDSQECFIPVFEVPEERVFRGRRALLHAEGMSASFYLRRGPANAIGPFDSCLGPGTSLFQNSDDTDFVYRTITSGFSLVKTPAIVVQHYGSRDYRSGAVSRLIRVCMYSLGAVDMKLLRSGEPAAIVVIGAHIVKHLAHINLRNVFLRRGPSGLAWFVMYICGLCASFRLGVDRRRRLYVAEAK